MIQYISFTVQLHGGEKGLNFTPEQLKDILKKLILNDQTINIERNEPFENNVVVDIDEVAFRSNK